MHCRRFLRRFVLPTLFLSAALALSCQSHSGPDNPATRPYKPINVNDPSDVRIPSGGRMGR